MENTKKEIVLCFKCSLPAFAFGFCQKHYDEVIEIDEILFNNWEKNPDNQ